MLMGDKAVKNGDAPKPLLMIPAESFGESKVTEYVKDYIAGRVKEYSGVACYLSNISKGKLNEWIDGHLEHLRRITEVTGNPIFAGNLGQIERLTAAGISVAADYGMNAVNRASLSVLRELGCVAVVEGLEFREDVSGAVPLMVSEQPIAPEGTVLTGKTGGKREIEVVHSPLGDKTYVIATFGKCMH